MLLGHPDPHLNNHNFVPSDFGNNAARNQPLGFDVPSASIGYTHDAPSILLVKTGILGTYGYTNLNDPNTFTWDRVMGEEENREKWLEEATQFEITALQSKQTWDKVAVDTALTKIIPVTWVF
jgi:hypothetical protein